MPSSLSLEKLFIGHHVDDNAKQFLLKEYFKHAQFTALPAIITCILIILYESTYQVTLKTWVWPIAMISLQYYRYYFSSKANANLDSKKYHYLYFSTDSIATICWLAYPIMFSANSESYHENLLRGFLIFNIFVFYLNTTSLHLKSLLYTSFIVCITLLIYALNYGSIPSSFIFPVSLMICFGLFAKLYFGRSNFKIAYEGYKVIEKNQDLIKKMDHIIIEDELTKLPNRRFFNTEIEKLLSSFKVKKETFSFAMIDIDRFKQINDAYGHDAGDIVLFKFGQFILSEIREDDILIRYGGEEFILILPNTSLNNAVTILERIRTNCLKNKIFIDDQDLTLSISIGVTGVDANDSKITLLKRADYALYQSKNNGRNQLNSLPPPH